MPQLQQQQHRSLRRVAAGSSGLPRQAAAAPILRVRGGRSTLPQTPDEEAAAAAVKRRVPLAPLIATRPFHCLVSAQGPAAAACSCQAATVRRAAAERLPPATAFPQAAASSVAVAAASGSSRRSSLAACFVQPPLRKRYAAGTASTSLSTATAAASAGPPAGAAVPAAARDVLFAAAAASSSSSPYTLRAPLRARTRFGTARASAGAACWGAAAAASVTAAAAACSPTTAAAASLTAAAAFTTAAAATTATAAAAAAASQYTGAATVGACVHCTAAGPSAAASSDVAAAAFTASAAVPPLYSGDPSCTGAAFANAARDGSVVQAAGTGATRPAASTASESCSGAPCSATRRRVACFSSVDDAHTSAETSPISSSSSGRGDIAAAAPCSGADQVLRGLQGPQRSGKALQRCDWHVRYRTRKKQQRSEGCTGRRRPAECWCVCCRGVRWPSLDVHGCLAGLPATSAGRPVAAAAAGALGAAAVLRAAGAGLTTWAPAPEGAAAAVAKSQSPAAAAAGQKHQGGDSGVALHARWLSGGMSACLPLQSWWLHATPTILLPSWEKQQTQASARSLSPQTRRLACPQGSPPAHRQPQHATAHGTSLQQQQQETEQAAFLQQQQHSRLKLRRQQQRRKSPVEEDEEEVRPPQPLRAGLEEGQPSMKLQRKQQRRDNTQQQQTPQSVSPQQETCGRHTPQKASLRRWYSVRGEQLLHYQRRQRVAVSAKQQQVPVPQQEQQEQQHDRRPSGNRRHIGLLLLSQNHLAEQQLLHLVQQQQEQPPEELLYCPSRRTLSGVSAAAQSRWRTGRCLGRGTVSRSSQRLLALASAAPSSAGLCLCARVTHRCFSHTAVSSVCSLSESRRAAARRLLRSPRITAAASASTRLQQSSAGRAAARQRRVSLGGATAEALPAAVVAPAAVASAANASAGRSPTAFFLSDEELSEEEDTACEATGKPLLAPTSTGMAAGVYLRGGAGGGRAEEDDEEAESEGIPLDSSSSSGIASSTRCACGDRLAIGNTPTACQTPQTFIPSAAAARRSGVAAAADTNTGTASFVPPAGSDSAAPAAAAGMCCGASTAVAEGAKSVTASHRGVLLPSSRSETAARLLHSAEGAAEAAAAAVSLEQQNDRWASCSTVHTTAPSPPESATAHVAVRSVAPAMHRQNAGDTRRDSADAHPAVATAAAAEAACAHACLSSKSAGCVDTDVSETRDVCNRSVSSIPPRRSSDSGHAEASRCSSSTRPHAATRCAEEHQEADPSSSRTEGLATDSSRSGRTGKGETSSITSNTTSDNNSSFSSGSSSSSVSSVVSVHDGCTQGGPPSNWDCGTVPSDVPRSSGNSNDTEREEETNKMLSWSREGKGVDECDIFSASSEGVRVPRTDASSGWRSNHLLGGSGIAMAFASPVYRALTWEMEQLEAAMTPGKEQERALANFLEQLQELLSNNLEACVVAAFGSAVNGLWTPYSDVDVCVQLSGAATRPLQVKALRQIAQALQPVQTYYIETRFQARVPIIHWAPRTRRSSSGYKAPKAVIVQHRQLAEQQQQQQHQHWRDYLQQAARRHERTPRQEQLDHSALSERQCQHQQQQVTDDVLSGQQQWQQVLRFQQKHELRGALADEHAEPVAPKSRKHHDGTAENSSGSSCCNSPASLPASVGCASATTASAELSRRSQVRRIRQQQQQQQAADSSSALSLRGNRGAREEHQDATCKHMIACDISVNNLLAVVNSKLLEAYVKVDPRLRTLGYAVKWWARGRYINDRSRGTISSFSLILMLINFLQRHTFPPILPSLQDLAIIHHVPPVYITGVDCRYTADRDLIQQELAYLRGGEHVPPNTQSAGELLVQFFRYFGYEYKGGVIDIRDTSSFLGHSGGGCSSLAEQRAQRFSSAASLHDVYNAWNRAATAAAEQAAAAAAGGATGTPRDAAREERIAGLRVNELDALNFFVAGSHGAAASDTFVFRDAADGAVDEPHYEHTATGSYGDSDFLVVDNPFEIGKDVCNLLPCQHQRIRHEFKRAYSMLSDGVPLQQVAAPDFR